MVMVKNSYSSILRAVLILIPALAALSVFWPAVYNRLLWDDKMYLFNQEYLDSVHWSQLFHQHFLVSTNYYRPLVTLSYMAEIKVHQLIPYYFHLVNIVIHAINVLLVTALAWQLVRRGVGEKYALIAATLAGLFYGFHITQVEAVAWISGRFDLAVTLFVLLALAADTWITPKLWRSLAVGICFLAAALSKEMAVAFAFILPVWHLSLHGQRVFPLKQYIRAMWGRGDIHVYMAVIIAGCVYLAVRFSALNHVYAPPSTMAGSPLQHILLVGKSIGWYWSFIVYPFALTSPMHPDKLPLSLSDPLAWGALFLLLVICVLLWRLIRRQPRIGWLWVAFLLAFIPVINVFPLVIGDNIVHERFLMLPLAIGSVALAVSAAWGLQRIAVEKQRLALVSAFLFSLLWSAASVANIRVTIPLWSDDPIFWEWAVARHPDSALANANLADIYAKQGKLDKALEHGLRSLELYPYLPTSFATVGNVLLKLGRGKEALEYYQLAVAMCPTNPNILSNAAAALIELSEYDKAEPLLLMALKLAPQDRAINANIGTLYYKTGRKALALKHYEVAMRFLSENDKEKLQQSIAALDAEYNVAAKAATNNKAVFLPHEKIK